MCEYQAGTIECRGDGYLWDADSDGYDPEDTSEPCPACNTAAFLKAKKEVAESTSWFANNYGGYEESGTGVGIWRESISTAMYWDSEAAFRALKEIGEVVAIAPAKDPKDVIERRFMYA